MDAASFDTIPAPVDHTVATAHWSAPAAPSAPARRPALGPVADPGDALGACRLDLPADAVRSRLARIRQQVRALGTAC